MATPLLAHEKGFALLGARWQTLANAACICNHPMQAPELLATGLPQNTAVIVALLNSQGLKDANFASVLVVLNTDKQAHRLSLPARPPARNGKRWTLRSVHLPPTAADKRVREASLNGKTGELLVPGPTEVVRRFSGTIAATVIEQCIGALLVRRSRSGTLRGFIAQRPLHWSVGMVEPRMQTLVVVQT